MKNIFINGHYEAIDGEIEDDLGLCNIMIRSWRTSYMRKNSKHDCYIQLRCFFPVCDPDFWKFYLELYVNNKMVSQSRIRHEAFDVLAHEKPKEEYQNVEFVRFETFTANKKSKA